MLQDHEFFARLCEERGISLIPEIFDAIRVSSTTGELRLSCLSIMIPVCEIIARTLVSSSTIKTLDLSDCMLLSKGLASILDVLCEGTAVTTLNLKGNNVNGAAVARLGRMLACNNTLKRLRVEWNSVGSNAESFAVFCDGLTKNHNIEQLDLRYNQIASQCAEHICKMIRKNKSLKSIDLSWNTLGLQGGWLLLNAMRENKTITDLVLRGNRITEDIAFAIEERLQENRRVRATTEFIFSTEAKIAARLEITDRENSETSVALRGGISLVTADTRERKFATAYRWENIKTDNFRVPRNVTQVNDKVVSSVEKISKVNPKFQNSDSDIRRDTSSIDGNDKAIAMTMNAKITDLGKMLQERAASVDLLTNEVAIKIAQVNDARTQLDLLQIQMNLLQRDKEKFDLEKAEEIAKLRKNHDEEKKDWRKTYKDLKDNYDERSRRKKEAESKIRQYEKEIHKISMEINLLRDKLTISTQAYKNVLSKNKIEIRRLKRELKRRENKHRIERNLLKSMLKQTTQALEDHQVELQKSRSKSRNFRQNQALLKAKLDDMECKMLRFAKLKESYQRIEKNKNILMEKLDDSQRIVSSLQRQIANLQGELIEPQRRHDLIKKELDLEKQISERLNRELHEESAKRQNQNLQAEKMNQQIITLNTQLNELRVIHAEVLHEREVERKHLQDIISNKEHSLLELRSGEIERAGQLYTAFNKYLSSIDPTA